MARWQGKEGLIGFVTAIAASSCCLLPLAVVFFGIGGGAFMMTTMQFRPLLVPLGLVGLATSYSRYVRERRRRQTCACAMVGTTLNVVMLTLATLIMLGVVWANLFAV